MKSITLLMSVMLIFVNLAFAAEAPAITADPSETILVAAANVLTGSLTQVHEIKAEAIAKSDDVAKKPLTLWITSNCHKKTYIL